MNKNTNIYVLIGHDSCNKSNMQTSLSAKQEATELFVPIWPLNKISIFLYYKHFKNLRYDGILYRKIQSWTK